MSEVEGRVVYEVPRTERNWAVVAHLCSFFLIFPLPGIIGPLIIWKLNKESKFISENAVEALNFQITITLATLAAGVLSIILIGYFLMFAVAVIGWIFSVIAALRTIEREIYRYPYSLRLVKLD